MKVPLAVLADYANVTADGKLNIMGMFNRIFAGSMPVVHPQMRLVMRFEGEPAERGLTKNVEIKLLDADGKSLLDIASAIQLPEDAPLKAEFQHIAEINGLRFERYGDYSFYILVNGETKAQITFEVAPTPAPGHSPPATRTPSE